MFGYAAFAEIAEASSAILLAPGRTPQRPPCGRERKARASLYAISLLNSSPVKRIKVLCGGVLSKFTKDKER